MIALVVGLDRRMAYEPPPDLLKLKTDFLTNEAELPTLAGEKWQTAFARSQKLALEIHRHAWWSEVDNRHSAWMALLQAAKEQQARR
ncbi:hypothetical protein ACQP10_19745 [Streptosporangium sandarakinum]|uniref:hypothetical protein n=1 Tax=Streptosporangium TaxID=2000 RepID=UPI0031F80840